MRSGPRSQRPIVHGSPDVVAPVAVVPEHGVGVRRAGRACSATAATAGTGHPGSPRRGHELDAGSTARRPSRATTSPGSQLVGHVRARRCTGRAGRRSPTSGADRYLLDGLTITLPVPEHAAELGCVHRPLDARAAPGRLAVAARRVHRREPPRPHVARAPAALFAGTPGYGEWHGEVWGAHLAWSGNHVLFAERLPDGRRYLQLGELLHPGELVLEPGETYRTPEVVAVHATRGLTAATQRFHRHLRARPSHPSRPARCWSTRGRRSTSTTTSTAAARSPTAPPRSASSASCSTTAGSGRAATTRPGSATGSCRPTSHPDGLGAADRPRQRSRHGVRHLGRAGDGQPRQRPVPRPPRVGAHHRRLRARARPATSSCSTSPEPEAFEHVLGQLDALLARPRHRLREVGHEPRPHRRAAAPMAPRAPTPRRWRSTGCSTSCGPPPRRRDRVAARPVAPASTTRSCAAPSASGPATATTRSSARRSSAARRC